MADRYVGPAAGGRYLYDKSGRYRFVPFSPGSNQFPSTSARGERGDSLLQVTFDFRGLEQLARKGEREAVAADKAILRVHHTLAEQAQFAIQQALLDAIKNREGGPRPQRPEQRLVKAIVDKRNRKADLRGWSVGYLDEAWTGEVAKYYRNLEKGTSVFVGRFIRGAFQDVRGRLVRPEKGGRDPRFVQFGPTGPLTSRNTFVTARGNPNPGQPPRVRGVLIKNPIKPYRYFERGEEQFRRQGGFRPADIMDEYAVAFQDIGADFFARLFTTGVGRRGSRGRPVGVASRMSSGLTSR